MPTPTLKQYYTDKIVPALRESKGYKNIHDVPGIQKVVINSGIKANEDKGVLDDTAKEIGTIAGQKPIITKARASISNFKLREGMPIGVKVTLRGAAMWDFLFRLINIALPGIRDFRDVSSKLDGNGNYNLGISDHTIFPEISMDTAKRHMGMDITIVTTASTDEEGHELLKQLGMPFRKKTTSSTATTEEAKPEAAPAGAA